MTILFGTAGIPNSTKNRNAINGIQRIRELGLDAMELEFVYQIWLNKVQALKVREVAKENKVKLTCHGSYYINLNSYDKKKWHSSISRILKAAEIAYYAGAYSVTFHPGYYQKSTPEETYSKIKEALLKIVDELKKKKIDIRISLETTGKHSQFGSLQEILRLSKEIKQVWPCIDFAHLHARANGQLNTNKEFDQIFKEVKSYLGKSGLKDLHMHVSGINYTSKGERNHLNLKESDFKIKQLIRSLKDNKVSGILICESPSLEIDADYMKKRYNS